MARHYPLSPAGRRFPRCRSASLSGRRPRRPFTRHRPIRHRHLSIAPPSSPWDDRTHPAQPSLPCHRCRVRTALFFTRLYNRLLRPGLAASFNHHRWQIRSPNLAHSQKIPTTEAELKEMLPTARRFAVLMDRTIVSPARFQALEGGARALGVQLRPSTCTVPPTLLPPSKPCTRAAPRPSISLPRPHFSPPSTSSEHSLRCTTCRRFAHHGRWPSLGDWQVMQPSCTSFPAPSPTSPTRC